MSRCLPKHEPGRRTPPPAELQAADKRCLPRPLSLTRLRHPNRAAYYRQGKRTIWPGREHVVSEIVRVCEGEMLRRRRGTTGPESGGLGTKEKQATERNEVNRSATVQPAQERKETVRSDWHTPRHADATPDQPAKRREAMSGGAREGTRARNPPLTCSARSGSPLQHQRPVHQLCHLSSSCSSRHQPRATH